jgi:tRNA dimethylallyltransferase
MEQVEQVEKANQQNHFLIAPRLNCGQFAQLAQFSCSCFFARCPSLSFNLLTLLGPTASGKTRLGVLLARHFGGEIISADSRQVYRGLNIGAGKDLAEYSAGGPPVPYHLIDIMDLTQEFSVFHFREACLRVMTDCWGRNVLPVLVGGTGLYLEAVLGNYRLVPAPADPDLRHELEGLDNEALVQRLTALRGRLHNTTDLAGRDRLIRAIEIAEHERRAPAVNPGPELRPIILGVSWERDALKARIRQRLLERLDGGLMEEVAGLHEQGMSWERLRQLGLEYRYVAAFLQGQIPSRDKMAEELYRAICGFAKRQQTWFRRMERKGIAIQWVPGDNLEQALEMAKALIKKGYNIVPSP